MPKVTPPVLGYNNNVRHRGRVFHIQTEDSGVKSPRIVTHLFADGGRIIKTARIDYAEHVGGSDLAQLVRQLMKTQHKAMFSSLRAGELDALLEAACGPLPLAPTAPEPPLPPASQGSEGPLSGTVPVVREAFAPSRPSELSSPEAHRSRAISNPNLRKLLSSSPPSTVEALESAVSSLDASSSVLGAAANAESSRSRKGAAAGRKLGTSPLGSTQPGTSVSRPASRYGSAPSKSSRSIFGDGVLSEKSLDEVILSYLAEDLDGSSE